MSSSTVEDDTKLKDVLLDTLSNTGTLPDFKAKLGLEIVKLLEVDMDLGWRRHHFGEVPKTSTFRRLNHSLPTDEAAFALYLIRETLEQLGLHYTCEIFKTEIGDEWNLFRNKPTNYLKQIRDFLGRQSVSREFSNTENDERSEKSTEQPLLIQLIEKLLRNEISSSTNSFADETFVKSSGSGSVETNGQPKMHLS